MPNSLPPLSFDEVTQPAEEPFAVLNAMLNGYNVEQAGPANHVPLWLFARDASGKVQGGVRGQTYWSWCTIDVLSVAEPYRRQGIGSRLLARAEEIARGARLHWHSARYDKLPGARILPSTRLFGIRPHRGLSAGSYAALVHEAAMSGRLAARPHPT
jgi:GNAT superfamily N-acetyltransferase